DPSLGRLGHAPRRDLDAAFRRRAVLEDAVERLVRQVEALAVLLEALGDAHALLVVTEAAGQELREQFLPNVAERRVADVMPQRHRFDEVLVEAQRAGHRAPDLTDLEDVREPRAIVVADRREEDLRLVLRAAERLAVDDAVAVDREARPRRRRLLGLGAFRVRAAGRVGSEVLLLELLGAFPDPQRGDATGTAQPCLAFYSGRHRALA